MVTGKIKLLPDHVANQIAAGEVVQRPASVVKELMENALDAGADDIKLIVKDGGKTLIQVVDNGSGMNPIDARMAFERHATSKIASATDLFQLQTKGFRGEALASIAAVAHVSLKTKTATDSLGTLLQIEGSQIKMQEPVATNKGTAIAVKNLFYNIPARRKFLKSTQIEMRHINDEFYRLALAHPQISFSLIHNGNLVYQLPKSNRLQRISNLFGHKLKEKLVPVKEETDYIKITGYIGKPEFAKLKRGEQFFFVNNRFIKSPYLHHALLSAYEGLIKDKSYPSYFIYFDIDPKHIDVNIHPTKTEIKFDDEQTVYAILKVAAKHSLGQFNLSPSMDFDNRPDLEVPYDYHKKTPKMPDIKVDPDFNPFKEDDFGQPAKTSAKHFKKQADYWESLIHETSNETTPEPQTSLNDETHFLQIESSLNQKVFQFQKKYLITQLSDKLLMIHQNRAHQNVLYHAFKQQLQSGPVTSQQLMFPVEINLPKNDLDLLKNYTGTLQKMGFDISFSDQAILINGTPVTQKTIAITEIFEEIIHKILMGQEKDLPDIEDKLALVIARKAAIKSGQSLEENEMEKLIADLFQLPQPAYTPQGKRVFIEINQHDLDQKFNH